VGDMDGDIDKGGYRPKCEQFWNNSFGHVTNSWIHFPPKPLVVSGYDASGGN
jgi:hypothetical protein